MKCASILCLLSILAVGIPAQTTHLVGPNGYPQIGTALAAAVPGDFVHVLPGTYAPFTVTFGCTIRGLVPGGVQVQDLTGVAAVTIAAPASQVVHLAGLDFSIVTANAAGQATATVAIPGGAWLVDQALWFQGVTGLALPLQLSPVTGGLIR